jgi:hypothetical protein
VYFEVQRVALGQILLQVHLVTPGSVTPPVVHFLLLLLLLLLLHEARLNQNEKPQPGNMQKCSSLAETGGDLGRKVLLVF